MQRLRETLDPTSKTKKYYRCTEAAAVVEKNEKDKHGYFVADVGVVDFVEYY